MGYHDNFSVMFLDKLKYLSDFEVVFDYLKCCPYEMIWKCVGISF